MCGPVTSLQDKGALQSVPAVTQDAIAQRCSQVFSAREGTAVFGALGMVFWNIPCQRLIKKARRVHYPPLMVTWVDLVCCQLGTFPTRVCGPSCHTSLFPIQGKALRPDLLLVGTKADLWLYGHSCTPFNQSKTFFLWIVNWSTPCLPETLGKEQEKPFPHSHRKMTCVRYLQFLYSLIGKKQKNKETI